MSAEKEKEEPQQRRTSTKNVKFEDDIDDDKQ